MAERIRTNLNVNIDEQTAAAIDRLAEQEMVKRTVIARRALREYLALHLPHGLDISTVESHQRAAVN